MKLLRVLLVDDEIMIREGFKRLFDWQAPAGEEKTILSLTRYLQEHLSEEISLALLADVFHLNPQ